MAKILIAKVGTDAHDMGITVVERWLRDTGHEVVNLGLYNTPERVAEAAAREKPDVVGLSFLGGEPVYLSGRVLETLAAEGADTAKLVVGGVLTPDMVRDLTEIGVAACFTPGTSREAILDGVAQVLAGDRRNMPPDVVERSGPPGR